MWTVSISVPDQPLASLLTLVLLDLVMCVVTVCGNSNADWRILNLGTRFAASKENLALSSCKLHTCVFVSTTQIRMVQLTSERRSVYARVGTLARVGELSSIKSQASLQALFSIHYDDT